MPRRLLLITYAFAPVRAPESYLSAKALSQLQGYQVDVLTIDPKRLGLLPDHSMDAFVSQHFGKIYRVPPSTWVVPKIFALFRFVMHFPDRFAVLNGKMFKAALNCDVESYDVIMSWSQWHSIHLVAARLKRVFPTVHWIAHFSDPWVDNPFFPKIPGLRLIQRRMERGVIRNASSVHFTTNETRDLVMRKYPVDWMRKSHVIPHTYVPSLYPEFTGSSNGFGNYVVRYLGNFYGPRNPRSLAQALALLQKEKPSLVEGISIEIVGRWIGQDGWNPAHEGVTGNLLIMKEPVSYLESLGLMRQADMLLIIDAPSEKGIFFPSKLVDYLGAGRPILAFTPNGSCADILKKVGGLVASPDSVTSIKNGLEMAISELKSGKAIIPNALEVLEYEVSHVSLQYALLLDRLLSSD